MHAGGGLVQVALEAQAAREIQVFLGPLEEQVTLKHPLTSLYDSANIPVT